MLEMEEWLMLSDLHTRGMNITQISKKTGYDRKTVHKHLDSTSMPEPPKWPKKESKLDNYKDYITAKLHEGPYTAKRLYREIQLLLI
jgi:transposase